MHMRSPRRTASLLAMLVVFLLPLQAFALTNAYISNVDSDTVSVINISTNTVSDTISAGTSPLGIAKSGTGLYVTNSDSNTVKVFDTTDNQLITTITVGTQPFYAIAYGTGIYVANTFGASVSVIDTTTLTVEKTITVGSLPFDLVASGTGVFVTNSNSIGGGNSVSVIDTTTLTVDKTISVGSAPFGIATSGTGVYVINQSSDSVSVINTTTLVIDKTISITGSAPAPVDADATGTGIFITDTGDDAVRIIDTTTNTLEDISISVGADPRGIDIVDNTAYVSNSTDGTVSVIDLTTNSVDATITVGSNPRGVFIATILPTVSTFSPSDGATDIAIDADLALTFSSTVGTTGTGTVSIYRASDDALIEQIAVTGSLVTGSGTNTITINPTDDLAHSTDFYVQISGDAFPDQYGDYYAGISNKTTWNFTTAAAPSSSSSSSSSAASVQRAGGVRQETLLNRMENARFGSSSSSHRSVNTSYVTKEVVSDSFKERVCTRVFKWFTGNSTMLSRVNTRLLNRFNFVCR